MRYLLILAMLCFGLGAPSTASAGGQSVARAVNAIRAAHGLQKLRWHPALQQAARYQSRLMAQRRNMSHSVSYGNSFTSRLRRIRYHGPAAENIAVGQVSLRQVLTDWMKSPGHRRNLLNPRMRYFGLSRSRSGGRNYWTIILGG